MVTLPASACGFGAARQRLALTTLLLALLAAPWLLAQNAAVTSRVDRTQLMRDVTTLASPQFEGRAAGTEGGTLARQWIVERFQAIGLTPGLRNGYLQRVAATMANVVGLVPGRELAQRVIVISAHYDHQGIQNGVLYPGADDNASGVAALLAAASYFRTATPRHSLIFVAFDAEEDGARGSRAFVRANVVRRESIALNINLDMVSRNPMNQIYAAGTSHYPALKPILDDVQTRSRVRILYGHDRPADGALNDWTTQSDHVAFHEAKIPFIYFGVENHPDYHRPSDTADRINPQFFGDAADMIVEAIRTFDTRLN